jgi:hypothetical protein
MASEYPAELFDLAESKTSCVKYLDSQPYHTAVNDIHYISKLIENRTRYDSYSAQPQSTKPFFIRVQDVCGRLEIGLDRIQETTHSQYPPWMMRAIICDGSILGLLKRMHQEVKRCVYRLFSIVY